ncbi:MAG: S-methyl-5-thioribose-1-phosphate isomerase [Bauldia sp.]
MSDTARILARLARTVEWRDGDLYLLDQTRLPHEVVVERQDSAADVFQAIRTLKVRGAPAIGVAAAYGLCVAVKPYRSGTVAAFREAVDREAAHLDAARPTAVNLGWALRRMQRRAAATQAGGGDDLFAALLDEAVRIHEEDQRLCLGIGLAGAPLIAASSGVLTHCNAGALCATGIGTATAPMYVAHERGVPFRVYADETRPLLQGARLTAWELQEAGLDVTVITDSMAAGTMAAGLVDLVITGADRVARNGDAANKIGTLGVAILARHFGIPFYIAAPSSTLDFDCLTGRDIPIEQRAADEVLGFAGVRTAPAGAKARNPAFDVTPHDLIAGIITERGIVRAPFDTGLSALFGRDYSA